MRPWDPGREVRFDRPSGLGLVAAPPFVLAGYLSGPVDYYLGRNSGEPLLGRLFEAGVVGLGGVVVGTLALAPLAMAMPRRVVLDWSSRALTVEEWRKLRRVRFDDLIALRLKCLKNDGSGKRRRYDSYHCEVHASVRALKEPESVLLVATRKLDSPDTLCRQSLSLATELADALRLTRPTIEHS